MIIDFDKYIDGEPITIIENGIAKTYYYPKISLSYVKSFPLTKNISFNVIGEYVEYKVISLKNGE